MWNFPPYYYFIFLLFTYFNHFKLIYIALNFGTIYLIEGLRSDEKNIKTIMHDYKKIMHEMFKFKFRNTSINISNYQMDQNTKVGAKKGVGC